MKLGSADSTIATPISSSWATMLPPTEATSASMLGGKLPPLPTRTYCTGTAWAATRPLVPSERPRSPIAMIRMIVVRRHDTRISVSS